MASGKAGDGPCLGIASEKGLINAIPLSQPGTTDRISTGFICDQGAGFYCSYSQDPAQQKCQALGAPGASCDNELKAQSCKARACEGFSCDAIVPAGQACGSEAAAVCDAASYCDFSGGPGPGVCVTRSPGGTACGSSMECTTDSCDTTNHCSINPPFDELGFCGRNIF
jgi:hypothetical protein